MGPGSLLVGLGLLGLSLLVIVRPWRVQAGRNDAAEAPASALSHGSLVARRDGIYGALGDLDFDRSVGKLNDDDYQAVRSQLMAQAVETLQQLDTSSANAASMESQVEALVRARRAASSRPASSGRPGAMLGALHVYCTACGSALRPDDRFCGQCGAPVAARCPCCGAAVAAGDGFCVRCGSALLAGAAA